MTVVVACAVLYAAAIAVIVAVGRQDARVAALLPVTWQPTPYAATVACDSCGRAPAVCTVVARGRAFAVCGGCAPTTTPLPLPVGRQLHELGVDLARLRQTTEDTADQPEIVTGAARP